jgi:hypothetical protein
MKNLFKNNLSVIAIIIATLITTYFAIIFNSISMTSISYQGSSSSISLPDDRQSDTAFGGLFAFIDLPDTIPHKQYKKLEDSINAIRQQVQRENKSLGGLETGFGPIGAMMMPEPFNDIEGYNKKRILRDSIFQHLTDSAGKLHMLKNITKDKDSITKLQKQINDLEEDSNKRANERTTDSKNNQLYYLTLTGYTLKNAESQFYISKGTYNLTYVKWDSIKKVGTDSNRYGHYQSKQIPIRYATEKKKIMIPVSYKQYRFVSVCLNTLFFILYFFSMYILLGLPIQVLANISRGKAFIKKNIRMFRQMSIGLFVYSFFAIFFPYIMHLLLWKMISEDFALPSVWHAVFNNLYVVLVAVILFLIGEAFKKGYKLQQEQNLTI